MRLAGTLLPKFDRFDRSLEPLRFVCVLDQRTAVVLRQDLLPALRLQFREQT